MTAPTPVEIELKLALPPQQAARFVSLMARRHTAPVRQVLRTRYFDTPDFVLSAQGVALRTRQLGRRWVQTLKTEGERSGGLSRRAEYEMPVSRGTPDWSGFPAEALAWVPVSLRGQLVPVFETRFTRTVWRVATRSGAQIEVALDTGEVRAGKAVQPVCEIELELKAGEPDALFVLAESWAQKLDCVPLDVSKAERGVRLALGRHDEPVRSVPVALNGRMTVEAGFAAVVQACLTQFQANLPGVQTSTDIEYVHQARVALRRLRAVLRLIRRVCVPPEALMAGLHALTSALGPARDWDVLCGETLPAIAPSFDDAAVWQQGMDALQSQRASVRKAMQRALTDARPGAWLLACQRWLLQRGWQDATQAQRRAQRSPLKPWARKALRKRHRKVVRHAEASGLLHARQLHALRIAIKQQRYAVDFFGSLFGRCRKGRYQASLQQLQDSLGRANDARMAKVLLTGTAADTGPMGPFSLGWLSAKQAAVPAAGIAKQLKRFVKRDACW
ncbi:MAG: CHAD domain-containing protein [Thiobacillus sp.]